MNSHQWNVFWCNNWYGYIRQETCKNEKRFMLPFRVELEICMSKRLAEAYQACSGCSAHAPCRPTVRAMHAAENILHRIPNASHSAPAHSPRVPLQLSSSAFAARRRGQHPPPAPPGPPQHKLPPPPLLTLNQPLRLAKGGSFFLPPRSPAPPYSHRRALISFSCQEQQTALPASFPTQHQ